jgi:hypothetical protein
MKIINNQDLRLIEEIKKNIDSNSKVYLSSNHFTTFAMFELIESLSFAKQVSILLSYNTTVDDDFRFIQNNSEAKLNLLLDRKFKINRVLDLLQHKVKFRNGSLGNQNVLIIENNGISTCYSLTPLDLDSVCLGILISDTPIFINSFEDINNQYLTLFNNVWNNSNRSMDESITELLKKGTKNHYRYCIKSNLHRFNYTQKRRISNVPNVGNGSVNGTNVCRKQNPKGKHYQQKTIG